MTSTSSASGSIMEHFPTDNGQGDDRLTWELNKDRPLSDFFLPPVTGEDYIEKEPFSSFTEIFDSQFSTSGKQYGAIHFKFGEELASKVKLAPHHLGVFQKSLGYQWESAMEPNVPNQEAIFANRMLGTKKLDLISSGLLQSGGSYEPANAQLSENSSIAQLNNFMIQCVTSTEPVFIGTEAQVNAVSKFQPMENLNIFKMKDYLSTLSPDEYPALNGISLPYAITGKTKSVTSIHLEDLEMMSMNMMIIPGAKLWVVVRPDFANVKKLVTHGANALKSTCHRWFQEKNNIISLKFLFDHDIKFNIIWQADSDIVITHPHGFHQIVNVLDCVNVARNLVTPDTQQCISDPIFKCSCDYHNPLACGLEITQQGFHQWVQKYVDEMDNNKTGTQMRIVTQSQSTAETVNSRANEAPEKTRMNQFCELCNVRSPSNHFRGKQHQYLLLCMKKIRAGGRLPSKLLPKGSRGCPICPRNINSFGQRIHHQNSTWHKRAFQLMKIHQSTA